MTGVHPKTNRSDGVAAVRELVERLVREVPVVDIHTHLFDPAQGELLLFGIDEILTYHYHVAELFRARPDLEPGQFWAMPTPARADLVWSELFVERSPLSDVGRGVVYLLDAFGLDPAASDLREARAFFAGCAPGDLVDQVFQLAGVRKVFMTNDPLDPVERATWLAGFERDPRFAAALRLDSAIMEWPRPVAALRERGSAVSEDLSEATITELTRYLREWQPRMDARYMRSAFHRDSTTPPEPPPGCRS